MPQLFGTQHFTCAWRQYWLFKRKCSERQTGGASTPFDAPPLGLTKAKRIPGMRASMPPRRACRTSGSENPLSQLRRFDGDATRTTSWTAPNRNISIVGASGGPVAGVSQTFWRTIHEIRALMGLVGARGRATENCKRDRPRSAAYARDILNILSVRGKRGPTRSAAPRRGQDAKL